MGRQEDITSYATSIKYLHYQYIESTCYDNTDTKFMVHNTKQNRDIIHDVYYALLES